MDLARYRRLFAIAYVVGRHRHNLHEHDASYRPHASKMENVIGLFGELEFGVQFDLMPDLSDKHEGDSYDFKTAFGTIDVKTTRNAKYLFLEEEKVGKVDILVLGEASINVRHPWVKLLGWEYDAIMRTLPKKDFGYGIINHFKLVNELRPMQQLKMLIENYG